MNEWKSKTNFMRRTNKAAITIITTLLLHIIHVCYLTTTATYALTTHSTTTTQSKRQRYDYDLIIIGGGASGMFAAGTSSGFGKKTLLIDQRQADHGQQRQRQRQLHVLADEDNFLGGDCSNAACVPSKSMRAVAQMAAWKNANANSRIPTRSSIYNNYEWMQTAQQHASDIVNRVRAREDVDRIMEQQSEYLDIRFCAECHFDSDHCLKLIGLDRALLNVHDVLPPSLSLHNNLQNNTASFVRVTSKKFLIATGAGPIVPQQLQYDAERIGLPLLTYRTFLQPEKEQQRNSTTMLTSLLRTNATNIVIAGGGSTACELAQMIARLCFANSNDNVNVTIVAPSMLPSDDVPARYAARKILEADGVTIATGHRVTGCRRASSSNSVGGNGVNNDVPKKYVIIMEDGSTLPCDALLLAVGRSPVDALQGLHLHKAGVAWTHQDGVDVDSCLRSKTRSHIFACGDCASAVHGPSRRASHAAWTGYHAVRNMFAPKLLQSRAVHPFVPRVTFTDPEIASIGLSHVECVRRHGKDGFQYLRMPEQGTDRGDMDSIQRQLSIGFTELRVRHNRILGATICSPAAAEAINEVALALNAGLSCDDLARTIHCYPSYGYPLQRIALAVSLSSVWGLLASCGKFGTALGVFGRIISRPFSSLILNRKQSAETMRAWQAMGADRMLMLMEEANENEHDSLEYVGRSFLDEADNDEFCKIARTKANVSGLADVTDNEESLRCYRDFVAWLDKKPC